MRLLLDHGNWPLDDFGAIATLQMAVRRIRRRLPWAELSAVTADPDRLAFLCPGVAATLPPGEKAWRPSAAPPTKEGVAKVWFDTAEAAQVWLKPLMRTSLRIAALHQGLPRRFGDCGFYETLQRADALVLAGGGYFADEATAVQRLDALDLAWRAGKRTLLMGHGCGPARSAKLEAAARRTLPRMDLISVRDGRFAPRWLKRWGVAVERITVAGDDAIELAHALRPDCLGVALGLNLGTGSASALDVLRATLMPLAAELGGELMPFAIGIGSGRNDAVELARFFAPQATPNRLPDDLLWQGPEEAIHRIGCCRTVVTASYHGAVFALAQGLPVVCLAASRASTEAFLGLAFQFGSGCQVVPAGGADLAGRVAAAVRASWHAADQMRSPLLRAAETQIERADAVYTRAFADRWLRRAAA